MLLTGLLVISLLFIFVSLAIYLYRRRNQNHELLSYGPNRNREQWQFIDRRGNKSWS